MAYPSANPRWKVGRSVRPRKAGLFALVTLLTGCMVHQPNTRISPRVPAAPQYHEAAATPAAADLPQPWWRTFEDATLDRLLRSALDANLELIELAARIEQAGALLLQARGRLYPQLDGSARYDSRWDNPEGSGPVNRDQSTALGALLSWELDVWGRLRLARQAGELGLDAAIQDWRGGRLLLSTAVAEVYFEILEQRQQQQLIRQQIEINETLLDLTRLRFGQGQSSVVDVLQQREQLASTLARLPDVEARLQQLEYSLDVLLGEAPGKRPRLPSGPLRPPPPLPTTGLPSDLLVSRPDLLAARARLVALDARVGEAVAERLPQVVIGGNLSAAGDPGLNTLAAGVFGAVAGPILDAGVRKAEVSLRQAQLEAALAAYSGLYLTAIQEVETAILRERKQAERVALLGDQLEIAQRLLTETRNRYSQGLTDYLPVLAAVVTEQNLQRESLTSQRQLLSLRVALHRALGGPMDGSPSIHVASNLP